MLTAEEKDPARGEERSSDSQPAPTAPDPPGAAPVDLGGTPRPELIPLSLCPSQI